MLSPNIASVQDKLSNWWEHGSQQHPLLMMSHLSNPEQMLDTDDLVRWWTDIDFVTRRQMQNIDNTIYHGVATPFHYIDFGASAMAGVLGAQMEYVNKDTIWAHPHLEDIDKVLDITWDHSNFCLSTILETARRSIALSHDHHFVAPWALGGVADNLAGLVGTENMLIAMIERPALVHRALSHLKDLWIYAFEEIQRMIAVGNNRGGVGWAGIWAPGTTFPIQEDCSYMISKEMFDTFCLPHIRDMVDAMDAPMYHLDGIGAIKHLDSLLEIEKLQVIQWVPGAGKEELAQWYELLQRIVEHKSLEVFAQPEELDALIANVGTHGLLVSVSTADNAQAEQIYARYAS